VFDQLTQVVQGDPPCLNDVRFSPEFIDFVNTWSVVLATGHLLTSLTDLCRNHINLSNFETLEQNYLIVYRYKYTIKMKFKAVL